MVNGTDIEAVIDQSSGDTNGVIRLEDIAMEVSDEDEEDAAVENTACKKKG